MYRVMFALFLLTMLDGCSKTVIPQTGNQFQVVSYSQLTDVTKDVTAACEAKVLDKSTCIQFATKLHTVKGLIDSEKGTDKAAEILNYIRSKL